MGRIEPWVRFIALVVWAFCGLSRLDHSWHLWVIPWLAYGILMLVAGSREQLPRPVTIAVLALQSVSVLALPRLGLIGFEGMLLSFVVVQLPTTLSMRTSIVWAVLQLALLWPIVWPFNNLTQMFEITGAYSGFSTFALLVHWVLLRERRARTELAKSNASLLATRALVVEGSRQAERLRISRELHDSLGHHLTALRLQLELAGRQSKGSESEALTQARQIAQTSLAEVRKVVSEMQTEQSIELISALRALASGVPSPRIEIRAPKALELEGGDTHHALFRCTQEAITNAVKHAFAKNIWVDIAAENGALQIQVRDDGTGAPQLTPGRGLTGMRERIAELGGELRFESPPGGGFLVQLTLPLGQP